MITAYFTNINNLSDDLTFNKMLDKVDINSKSRIMAYKLQQDQLLRLLSTSSFSNHLSMSDLQYSPSGKPYFNNDFNFSIAHSGDMVVCAGGVGIKIGADIEKESGLQINDMKDHFTAGEWAAISGTDTNSVFYKMWVRKEACIKATDKGVLMPLNEIDVCEDIVTIDDSQWYLHNLHLKRDYATCIATDKQDARIYMQEIDFDSLINQ